MDMLKYCPRCGEQKYRDDWYRRDFECGTTIDQFNDVREEGNRCLRLQLQKAKEK